MPIDQEYLDHKNNFYNQEELLKRRNLKSKKVTIVRENGEEITKTADLKKSICKKGTPQPKKIVVYNNSNEILFEIDRVARKRERDNIENLRRKKIQENRHMDQLERMKKERDKMLAQIKLNNERLRKQNIENGFFVNIQERKANYSRIEGLIIKKRKEINDLKNTINKKIKSNEKI